MSSYTDFHVRMFCIYRAHANALLDPFLIRYPISFVPMRTTTLATLYPTIFKLSAKSTTNLAVLLFNDYFTMIVLILLNSKVICLLLLI